MFQHYSKTIKPGDGVVNNTSIKLLLILGNITGAIFYYKRALAIQPNNTSTLDNMGMALNNQGNYTRAVEYFNRALAVNPNDEAALYNKDNALSHRFPTF